MGLFFNREQVHNFKNSWDILKEKKAAFKCETVQPIGIIPRGADVSLKLNPDSKVLVIRHDKNTEVTLQYGRIMGFRLECDKNFVDDERIGMAGEILSTGILGKTGKIAGRMMKGIKKRKIRWIGTLIYKDKIGETKELLFLQKEGDSYYDSEEKNSSAEKFTRIINKIAGYTGENITEL